MQKRASKALLLLSKSVAIFTKKGTNFPDYAQKILSAKKCSHRSYQAGFSYYDKFFKTSFKSIEGISPSDVLVLHQSIGSQSGTYSANRALEILSQILSMAKEDGLIDKNPCLKVKAFPEFPRERYIKRDEFPQFFKAIGKLSVYFQCFFLLLLYTGARKSNVASMRWKDIDFNSKTWAMSATTTKNKKALLLPLTPPAIQCLERMRDISINSEFVFPAKSKSGHLQEPKKAWEKIKKAHGLKDLRMHDLRRTFASYQVINGGNIKLTSKLLGHSNIDITAKIYAQHDIESMREQANKVANYMASFPAATDD